MIHQILILIPKILLASIAIICKSFVDTVAFHKGGKLKGSFWDINNPGYKVPYTKYSINGFHVMNTGMILFFCLAAFGFHWQVIVTGIVIVVVFNLFWNKILN